MLIFPCSDDSLLKHLNYEYLLGEELTLLPLYEVY